MKKILNLFLVSLFLFLSCQNVIAKEVADINKEGSIHISLKNENGESVNGVGLSLYKVADVTVDNGYIFNYSSKFNAINIDINSNLSKVEYVNKLVDHIKNNGIEAEVSITSNGDNVKFSNLKMGLYLVVQNNSLEGYTSMNPFLVTVPFRNTDGSLSYDVNATPKTSVLKKVERITPTQVIENKLPLTGQLWWPVWVLFCLGILFLSVGFIGKRNENI